MKVLVTGATGTLGSNLVNYATSDEYQLRILSRKSRRKGFSPEADWARGDLATGEGVAKACDGVDVIIHAATSPGIGTEAVDVEGTRRLVKAASGHGIDHLLFLSIVGIDDIPFSYYQHKLEAEKIVADGEVPYTILRATQFHELVDLVLSAATRMPLITWLPTDFKVQSIAASEVAEHLWQLAKRTPAGRVSDIGGPQVLDVGEMAEQWMDERHRNRKVFRLPVPGEIARAFREGRNTCPDSKYGNISWEAWLEGDGVNQIR